MIPPTMYLRTRTISTNRLRLGIHHISIIYLYAQQGENINNNGGGDDDMFNNEDIFTYGPPLT